MVQQEDLESDYVVPENFSNGIDIFDKIGNIRIYI